MKKTKCKNCNELIDLFIGKETKAKAWLHVINVDEGYLWGYAEESKKFCRNPQPKK